MCSRASVIILLSFAAATSVADSPVYSIDAHIIAAGSSVRGLAHGTFFQQNARPLRRHKTVTNQRERKL